MESNQFGVMYELMIMFDGVYPTNLMFPCTPNTYLVVITSPLCHLICVVQVYDILNIESVNSGGLIQI